MRLAAAEGIIVEEQRRPEPLDDGPHYFENIIDACMAADLFLVGCARQSRAPLRALSVRWHTLESGGREGLLLLRGELVASTEIFPQGERRFCLVCWSIAPGAMETYADHIKHEPFASAR